MNTTVADSIPPPVAPFPLVRHLSWRLSRRLVRLPVTPNQITVASIAPGLAATVLFAWGEGLWLSLPAGAIGSQVYWLSAFMRGADRFHV